MMLPFITNLNYPKQDLKKSLYSSESFNLFLYTAVNALMVNTKTPIKATKVVIIKSILILPPFPANTTFTLTFHCDKSSIPQLNRR